MRQNGPLSGRHFTMSKTFRSMTAFAGSLTPLRNDRILDLSKLKAFADDKMNVAKVMIHV